MKKKVWQDYWNYVDNIYKYERTLSEDEFDTLFQLYDRYITDETAKELKHVLAVYDKEKVYNYDLLKETLEDIINGTFVMKNDKKTTKKFKSSREVFNEIVKLNPDVELEYDETGVSTIFTSVNVKDLVLPEGFYYNEKNGITNKHNSKSGLYFSIDVQPLVKDNNEELLDNEEKVKDEQNKVGFFKRFYYNHIKKYDYKNGSLDPIDIEESKLKRGFTMKKLFNKIKSKFVKSDEKKLEYINNYVNKNYPDSDEVLSFMSLLVEREDKKYIINELYKYIKHYKNVYVSEEEFLDKLYDVFGIEKSQEEKIEPKEEIKEEKIEPKEEIKEEIKKEKRDITKLSNKYITLKNVLRDKLTKEEIMFIEDAYSEGLEIGDPEFDQMINERCTFDKRRIYAYLLNVEKIKLLCIKDNLTEYEKKFIEDAYSEGLEVGDPEFDQMASQRGIDKEVILTYYDVLNKSRNNQNNILKNYNRNFLKMNGINFNTKKIKELKEIAKDNGTKVNSKIRKEELINKLTELRKLKEKESEEILNLTK